MSTVLIICAHCGVEAMKLSGDVNRARAKGAPLYCGRECAGLAHPRYKTAEQKQAEKAEYDKRRRTQLGEELLARKRAEYRDRLARDPEGLRAAQRALRRVRRELHAEYCRTPEYRKWKATYDQTYRSRKLFGPFGEAAIILNQLEAEITGRASWIEIRTANGILNKKQTRRREYDRQTQRS